MIKWSLILGGLGKSSALTPTKLPNPVWFSDAVTDITGVGWTLRLHPRQIPTCRLSRWRDFPTAQTTRKPILLLMLSRSALLLLLRDAERQFWGLLIQEPPRSRVRLPLLYSLNHVSEVNICWRSCQVSPCSKWANQLCRDWLTFSSSILPWR